MAQKVTGAQMAPATFKIDDYRNMVNYQSGTNKGYVRFNKGSDGKLKIEKFNNKIDVPLSWRTNTSAAHNKAVREKFLAAIEGDFKFMGERGNKIRDMILRPKDANGKVDEGKALSRRELKEIFKNFDEKFNTGAGRIAIVDEFYADAMKRCDFAGDKDEFVKKFLKPELLGYNPTKNPFFEEDKDNENNPDPTKRMKMSETQFRAYLVQLDNLVDSARHRVLAENSFKSLARTIVKTGVSAGGKLPEETINTLRAALCEALKAEGVEIKNLGLGTESTTVELFIKRVLPVMIRQAAENARDFAEAGSDASIEEILEGELSIDRIIDTARRFIEKANATVAAKVEVPTEPKGIGVIIDTLRRTHEKQRQLAVFMDARQTFTLNVNLKFSEGMEDIAKGVGALSETYVKEAALENCATEFIVENFAKAARDIPQQDVNFCEKAHEHINELVVAGQLNFGERWAIDRATELKNVRLQAGTNVQAFLSEMSAKAIDIANELKGGMPMLDNLLKRTLANILNQKIANAVASKGEQRIHIDAESRLAVEKQLRLTAEAYKKFFHESEELLVGKAASAFKTQLDRLLKKGNISQDEYETLAADHAKHIEKALERAVERFYEKSPVAQKESDAKTVAEGAKLIEKFFSEEKEAVTAEMRHRIGSIVLANAYGGAERAKLLDSRTHVNACREKLEKDGVRLVGDFDIGDFTIALDNLYYKVLTEKLQGKKLGRKDIGANLNESVQSAFVSAAKDLVNGVNTLSKKLDERLRKYLVSTVDIPLGQGVYEDYKKNLGADAVKAMEASVADDMALSLKGSVDALKRKFLVKFETYSKKNVDADAWALAFFDAVNNDHTHSQDNIAFVYRGVVEARKKLVENWIDNPAKPGAPALSQSLVAEHKALALSEDSKTRKYAAAIPQNELNNIVDGAVKDVLEHARKYAVSYATGGIKTFEERINKEIQAAVAAHVKAHAEFRAQAEKDVAGVLDKYSDALRTPEKSGREVALAKFDSVMAEISREKAPPAIKGFVMAFDGMLKQLLMNKVDMKFAEFKEYSKKVTAAYELCLPAFEEKIKSMYPEMKANGATDDDIAYFEEKLMPLFREKLQTKIQLNVDSYSDPKIAAQLARYDVDMFVGPMVSSLADMDLSTPNGLLMTLGEVGLSSLVSNKDTTAWTKTAIATVLGNDDAQKIIADARKAVMTRAAYGANKTAAAVKEAAEATQKFHNLVSQAVAGIKTTVLEGRFNEFEVEPAVKLFEMWLEKYNLPDIPFSTDKIGTGTLKDAAVAHFRNRIAALQRKIAESGKESAEPLLSAAYVIELTTYINSICRTAMFTAMAQQLVTERKEAIMADEKHSVAYQFVPEADSKVNDTIVLNIEGLQKNLVAATRRAEKALRGTVVSLEDMYRWKDLIKQEFDKQLADDSVAMAQYHASAASRTEMMVSIDLDALSGDKAIDMYIDEALRAHFGGKDIADGKIVPAKLESKYKTTVGALVAHLKKNAKVLIDAQKANFKDAASKNPAPGEALLRFPNAERMERMFRDSAESVVEGFATQEKDDFSGFFRAIEKEVATILKNERKAAAKARK